MDTAVATQAKIKVKDLNFYYGKFHALKNINLENSQSIDFSDHHFGF